MIRSIGEKKEQGSVHESVTGKMPESPVTRVRAPPLLFLHQCLTHLVLNCCQEEFIILVEIAVGMYPRCNEINCFHFLIFGSYLCKVFYLILRRYQNFARFIHSFGKHLLTCHSSVLSAKIRFFSVFISFSCFMLSVLMRPQMELAAQDFSYDAGCQDFSRGPVCSQGLYLCTWRVLTPPAPARGAESSLKLSFHQRPGR